jgi:hypothetical protein
MSTNALSLCSLPVELVLEIVELVMYSTKNDQGTLLGSSAAWINPTLRPLTSQRPPTGDGTTVDKAKDKKRSTKPGKEETIIEHHPLKSLRM